MGTQGQQKTSPVETLQQTRTAREEVSNLSETARFVNRILREYVYPKLREKGMVDKDNEISREMPSVDDPRVVGSMVDCKQLEIEILEEARGKGLDEQGETVIKNFFAKLINMARTASDFKAQI